MPHAGFVLVELPPSGRRRAVVDFATLSAAKVARDLYACNARGSNFSVVPAAMLSDYLHGKVAAAV